MNVGFIGAGNMGGALARIICTYKHINVYIYDVDSEKSKKLAAETEGIACELSELINASDIIFLGVKPGVIATVCNEISDKVKDETIIISMAAGVKIKKIESVIKRNIPIIRIMPNTPVTYGEGMTAYCKNEFVTDDVEFLFKIVMKFTGTLSEVPEEDIEAFTAIAGCGPAYAYMFIDALAKAGEKCGLDYDRALFYATKMIKGSAIMVENSPLSPETLCKNVCSPGGSTIEGVRVLEANNFDDTIEKAIFAAYKRTKELGN